jgi:hypothetical protein
MGASNKRRDKKNRQVVIWFLYSERTKKIATRSDERMNKIALSELVDPLLLTLTIS